MILLSGYEYSYLQLLSAKVVRLLNDIRLFSNLKKIRSLFLHFIRISQGFLGTVGTPLKLVVAWLTSSAMATTPPRVNVVNSSGVAVEAIEITSKPQKTAKTSARRVAKFVQYYEWDVPSTISQISSPLAFLSAIVIVNFLKQFFIFRRNCYINRFASL